MSLWERCLHSLESEFPSQQFNTWIRPLQAEASNDKLILFAPNRFVLDWIAERFLFRIQELVSQFCDDHHPPDVILEIGSKGGGDAKKPAASQPVTHQPSFSAVKSSAAPAADQKMYQHNLNPNFTFDNFVEGKSNQLAKAACSQVAGHRGCGLQSALFIRWGGFR